MNMRCSGSSKVTDKVLRSLQDSGALRQTALQEQLDGGMARCGICQRRCRIPGSHTGFCGTVVNVGGRLHTTIYGVVSSVAADPIEKKPVYHYKPGSLCYSVGSLGCNFRCQFCQNWQIAYADSTESSRTCRHGLTPEL